MVHWQSEPFATFLRCAWIQASRSPSRARNVSWATAVGFMPSSGATSAGFIPSISEYQSASCHRDGRLRKARTVMLRSSASSVARSLVAGSSIVSRSSVVVSLRARPQPAAVLRMLVNRYARKEPVGPPPRRIDW